MRIALLSLAVVLVVPAIPTMAVGFGRDSDCVKAVNDFRAVCDDQCDTDCTTAFGSDPAALDACLSECHATCVDMSTDLKVLCRPIKE